MTDLFDEVQEDIRRDRMKALWERFGGVIIAIGLLIVVGVGGWRGYEYFQARASAAAGDQFEAASRLAGEGKTDEARAAFAKLATDGPEGYRVLARLREANEIASKDAAAALKAYQDVAGDPAAEGSLRDVARIRAAYLSVDHAPRDEVRRLVDALAATDGPFRPAAREALGLAAYKAGDLADARRHFEAIVGDPTSPPQVRQRADLMLAVVPAAQAPAAPTN